MKQPVTRRSLIVGGTSLATMAVSFPLVAGAQENISVDQFRALSARLTGVYRAGLDATATGKLLDGFISLGHGAELAALVGWSDKRSSSRRHRRRLVFGQL